MPQIVSNLVDLYPFRLSAGGVEFLLLHRAAGRALAGTWQAVHGTIEPGEAAHQAALRELREETALTPQAFWQIDFVNAFYCAASDRVMMCPSFAARIASADRVVLNCEHTEFVWLPVEEALEHFMWPGQRHALREIMDEIVRPGPAEPHLRIPLGQA